jgi:hypothetical protein
MPPRVKRRPPARRAPWYHRIQPATWVILWLLLAATVSASLYVMHRPAQPRLLKVEVLNGSGVPELAQSATDLLRRRGVDVVDTGNYDDTSYAQTLVLLRRGHLDGAKQVARALGSGEVMQQLDPTRLVDVTVVLGRDYRPDGAR